MGIAALAAPVLLSLVVPLRAVGPLAAWRLTSGRWLIAVAVAASALSLGLAVSGRVRNAGLRLGVRAAARLDAIPLRAFALGLFVGAFLTMLALIPGYRWAGDGILGDEPKYLRILESLYYDLDTDVGSGTREPPTVIGALRNLAWVGRTAAQATAGVLEDDPVPPDHVWRAGHLTVAGRKGGLYHLQSPGLPVLLLPALVIQRALWPEVTAPALPLATLAALWALGLTQGVLLAAEVSRSRLAGLVAGLATAFSAPVFLSGYHFYPEAAALALVPWLVRVAIGHRRGMRNALAAGLAIGVLPWLHVKFSLLALVLLVILVRRAETWRVIVAIAAPLAALGALLAVYHHRITGLLAPDALYRRYGPEIYSGPADFLSPDTFRGALITLVGAVDGLFVMAPVSIAGALAGVWLFRRDRPRAVVLVAMAAAIAIASAVHGGGAPGPPGRLMVPVACVFGAALAAGLVEMRGWPHFRWTVFILAVAGLSITVTLHGDWRRSVSPYRRMFASPDVDFSRLLPGMTGQSREARRRPDIARGAALLAIVGFWVWRCGRANPALENGEWTLAARAAALRNTHLAFWATIAVGTLVLTALGP